MSSESKFTAIDVNLRKNERNAKESLLFFTFPSASKFTTTGVNLRINESEQNINVEF